MKSICYYFILQQLGRFVNPFCVKIWLRVNLAITNNPKGGLLRGIAVSTACVIIRRKPATQVQSRQNYRKILAFRARSVFAVKMAR